MVDEKPNSYLDSSSSSYSASSDTDALGSRAIFGQKSVKHRILMARSIDLPGKPLEDKDVFQIMDHLRFTFKTMCYYTSTSRPSQETELNKFSKGLGLIESSGAYIGSGNPKDFTKLINDLKKKIERGRSELQMYDRNLEACRNYIVGELKVLRKAHPDALERYVLEQEWPTVSDCDILEVPKRLVDFISLQSVVPKTAEHPKRSERAPKLTSSRHPSEPTELPTKSLKPRRKETRIPSSDHVHQETAEPSPGVSKKQALPSERETTLRSCQAPENAFDAQPYLLKPSDVPSDSIKDTDMNVPSPSPNTRHGSDRTLRQYTTLDKHRSRQCVIRSYFKIQPKHTEQAYRAKDCSQPEPVQTTKDQELLQKKREEPGRIFHFALDSEISQDPSELGLMLCGSSDPVSDGKEVRDVTLVYPQGASTLLMFKDAVVDYKNKTKICIQGDPNDRSLQQYSLNVGIPRARFEWIRRNLDQHNLPILYSGFYEEQGYYWFRSEVGETGVCKSVYRGTLSNLTAHNHTCAPIKRPKHNIFALVTVLAKLSRRIVDGPFTLSFELSEIQKQGYASDFLG
ncbi:hypothetical protein BY458DRAFT_495511 [Sporodiniella umbellata]|nr:hypothetical protein BY458DRAFT_495511 [Sporodiniella umbellata]